VLNNCITSHVCAAALVFAAFATTAIGEAMPYPAVCDKYHDAVHIIANVVDPSGSPVPGAVVITSSGGNSVTDDFGYARFEVELIPGDDLVHVTAVALIDGTNHVGTVRLNRHGRNDVVNNAERSAARLALRVQLYWLRDNEHIVTVVDTADGAGRPCPSRSAR
jgi:hypothetical protein